MQKLPQRRSPTALVADAMLRRIPLWLFTLYVVIVVLNYAWSRL